MAIVSRLQAENATENAHIFVATGKGPARGVKLAATWSLTTYSITGRHSWSSSLTMPTIPGLPNVTQPQTRSGPTSPAASHHPSSRPPSPPSFQRNRLSVSVPNIVGLARADPLQPSSCPLEIRLSSDVVVLRGTGTQTTGLTGSVILHLAGATAIKGVGLRLLAKAKVALPLSEPCVSQWSLPVQRLLSVC
jgi:hypothetical protein